MQKHVGKRTRQVSSDTPYLVGEMRGVRRRGQVLKSTYVKNRECEIRDRYTLFNLQSDHE